jgi:hypothetical protein
MTDHEKVDRKKLSQAPSWVMAGFVVGVLTMWLFRSSPEPPPVAAEAPAVEAAEEDPEPTAESPGSGSGALPMHLVGAIWEEYRPYAFWNEDKTQIGVWNSETFGFTDRYEVLRGEEYDYFRPIESFTRLTLPGYGPENSPILFTETAEMRARREQKLNPKPVERPPRPDPVEFNTLPPPPGGG